MQQLRKYYWVGTSAKSSETSVWVCNKLPINILCTKLCTFYNGVYCVHDDVGTSGIIVDY